MIENIKKSVISYNYRFTVHALERCAERNISPQDVREALLSGEIIEEYPEDKYGQSVLILGTTENKQILHVQCSLDPLWIITAYNPTLRPERWDSKKGEQNYELCSMS
jgi:hypothetical protein